MSRTIGVTLATACAVAALTATGDALAEPAAGGGAAQRSHVTGDAWLRYPGDPQYPFRRFVVDAHGGPFKVVDGKITWGAAHGTIRFDHYAPDRPGGPSVHHWGSVKVDYVMTGGPVAVVSGLRQDDVPANMRRGTFTFYQDPRGHRYDRMGFSWGLVDPVCQQMGTGPAPFSPASAGPDGRWLKGYTVKDSRFRLPAGDVQQPDEPPNCVR
ncbi:hypothetical protein [Actinomadura macrotermitis]|uniref:Uncharacterized protein n=1 Tax=Actinomadura macrotermitis TaxID=2585200 RepID=A0A7K0BU76_9ACTN|nr:hypothetical protein [Actinomadura macrotermitis]MQY04729.1 hypothetical protein [Actinomadura macrotermitis]